MPRYAHASTQVRTCCDRPDASCRVGSIGITYESLHQCNHTGLPPCGPRRWLLVAYLLAESTECAQDSPCSDATPAAEEVIVAVPSSRKRWACWFADLRVACISKMMMLRCSIMSVQRPGVPGGPW
eukprot:1156069-Pelagomonas_calceolata.AAC.7